jgi:hypothetical protein
MSNSANRVLARTGARELTLIEIQNVTGGLQVHTRFCTLPNPRSTATGDGDGCDHHL